MERDLWFPKGGQAIDRGDKALQCWDMLKMDVVCILNETNVLALYVVSRGRDYRPMISSLLSASTTLPFALEECGFQEKYLSAWWFVFYTQGQCSKETAINELHPRTQQRFFKSLNFYEWERNCDFLTSIWAKTETNQRHLMYKVASGRARTRPA